MLGQSLLSQFESKVDFERRTFHIDSLEKAQQVRDEINHCAGKSEGEAPIIFDTLVDPQVRDTVGGANGVMMDVFQTFLNPLEKALRHRICLLGW